MMKKQVEFPLLEEYKKYFAVDKNTIFALGEHIYTNNDLTDDLLVHELVHLKQQEEMGVTEWVYDFLHDPEARLRFEVQAYREQIKSIKDRNYRTKVLYQSAKNLSSALYGNIITNSQALELLKI